MLGNDTPFTFLSCYILLKNYFLGNWNGKDLVSIITHIAKLGSFP